MIEVSKIDWSGMGRWLQTVLTALVIGWEAHGVILNPVGPTPTPSPAPTPIPVPKPDNPIPSPVKPTNDFFKLGGLYRDELVKARSASWSGAATQIAAGLSLSEAFINADKDFTTRRQEAFKRVIGPSLEALAPDGSKITSDQRTTIASELGNLARGLKTP